MRAPVLLTMFALAGFLLWADGQAAERQDWVEVFFRANQAYQEGRFDEAVKGYRRLIQAGQGNGDVYYNLGNAHIRLNQLGQAILSYERARLVLPRDADLDFNLRYAREQIKDVTPDAFGFISSTFFWLKTLSLAELFWGFAVLNVLFWAVLFMRLFAPREWTYYLLLLSLVLWVIAGVSFGLKWYQTRTDDRAVIVQEEVDVLAGPHTKDTILFRLHEGTMVNHERSEDGWSLIRFAEEKRGWVKEEAIGKIAAYHLHKDTTAGVQ